MRPTSGSEPIAESEELRLVYRQKDGLRHRLLDNLVLHCGDAQRSCSPVRLRYLYPPRRTRPVRSALNPVMQVAQPLARPFPFMPRHAIHACRCLLLQRKEAASVVMWCNSASFSFGFLLLAVSAPPCHARPALCPSCFGLAIPLGSSGSAGTEVPLFAALIGTMARSDCSNPFIIDSDYLLSSAAPVRRPGRIGALSGPLRGRTCVPGFLTPRSPRALTKAGVSVAFGPISLGTPNDHAPLPVTRRYRHFTCRSRRRRLVTPLSPAIHALADIHQRAVAANPIPCSGGTSSLALSRRRASTDRSRDPAPDPARVRRQPRL